jgi:hypothetical protein
VGFGSAGLFLSLFFFLVENQRAAAENNMGATARQNVSHLSAAGRAKAEEISHPKPVCIEVPVTIHGVRLLTDSGKREPFSEPTRTLIVLSNGAVLPLRTPVNPGQLIILTNEHTRKEIVCEVVKSTTCQNVVGYIEVH